METAYALLGLYALVQCS